ncbi:MAG: hypothetical protein AB7L09_00745 [Nitrospira sp.]
MIRAEWRVKSIKRWPDGSWDALIISTLDGKTVYDRVLSNDGFTWETKLRGHVQDAVQTELTSCIGDMLTHNIRMVVF